MCAAGFGDMFTRQSQNSLFQSKVTDSGLPPGSVVHSESHVQCLDFVLVAPEPLFEVGRYCVPVSFLFFRVCALFRVFIEQCGTEGNFIRLRSTCRFRWVVWRSGVYYHFGLTQRG